MKNLFTSLILTFIFSNGQTKQPYESKWLEITKTDSGYVVRNYKNLDVDTIKSFNKITVLKDFLTSFHFSSSTFYIEKIDSIKDLGNEKYIFVIDQRDLYKFEWFNKQKHIARWRMLYYDGRVSSDHLYIDSAYNTYPITEYVWKLEDIEGED